jgi:hypothetical protein
MDLNTLWDIFWHIGYGYIYFILGKSILVGWDFSLILWIRHKRRYTRWYFDIKNQLEKDKFK